MFSWYTRLNARLTHQIVLRHQDDPIIHDSECSLCPPNNLKIRDPNRIRTFTCSTLSNRNARLTRPVVSRSGTLIESQCSPGPECSPLPRTEPNYVFTLGSRISKSGTLNVIIDSIRVTINQTQTLIQTMIRVPDFKIRDPNGFRHFSAPIRQHCAREVTSAFQVAPGRL